MVFEGRVAKTLHPVKRVVVAVVVVDGGLGVEAETHVDRWNAGEVLERGEVAAGAHRGDVLVPDIVYGLPTHSLVWRCDELD